MIVLMLNKRLISWRTRGIELVVLRSLPFSGSEEGEISILNFTGLTQTIEPHRIEAPRGLILPFKLC